MNSANVIPQFVLDTHISTQNMNDSSAFYTMNEIEFLNNVHLLKKLLLNLSYKFEEVYCWFSVDPDIKRKQLLVLEQHLESKIENKLNNDIKIHVQLIPAHINDPLETYLLKAEYVLTPLSKIYPFDEFLHLNNYGNAKLNQSILIEGIRCFHSRYVTAYYDDGEIIKINYPAPIERQTWFSLFKTFLLDYDYQGAFELIDDLSSKSMEKKMIQNLLLAQIKRMNFAMEEAKEKLAEVIAIYPNNEILQETRKIFNNLLQSDPKKRDLERIVELFRQIDIFVDTDDIASFLVRFYRVREAVLFYLLKYARTSDEPIRISEKNSSIYEVFELLEELYDNWEIDGYYGAYFFLKSTNTYNILNFRNASFIGHGRRKIEPAALWRSFAGKSSITIKKAKRRFQMDVDLLLRDLGAQNDDNFFSINELIIRLAEQMRKKEGAYVE